MQEDIGLRRTDGELRRGSWQTDFRTKTLAAAPARTGSRHALTKREFEFTPRCTPASSRSRAAAFGEDSFSQRRRDTEAHDSAEPDPLSRRRLIDRRIPTWRILRRASMRQRSQAPKIGPHIFQLDDTSLAYLNDPANESTARQRRRPAAPGSTSRCNAAWRRNPAGQRSAHICRGNFRSSGCIRGYHKNADAAFNELQVDGFFRARRRQVGDLRTSSPHKKVRWCTRSGHLEKGRRPRKRTIRNGGWTLPGFSRSTRSP